MTKLTTAITATSLNVALTDIQHAVKAGAELIEIRLDYLDTEDFFTLVKSSPVPILWTLRHSSEGGKFTGSIERQLEVLARAISAGGEYVDVEFQRWQKAGLARQILLDSIGRLRAEGRNIKIILSFHDFESMPIDLSGIVQTIAADPDADVVKVAGQTNSVDDLFRLLDVIAQSPKPIIAIAMGSPGVASRVLAKKFGAEVSFATIEPAKASAPGQLTVEQMKNEYNWDRIGPETLLAGVVGHPIEHSLSPAIHNAAYRQMGVDAVYLRFEVAESYEDFVRFVDNLRCRPRLGTIGLSVTIPHKTNALRYVLERHGRLDPLAEKIGAVNTLVFSPDGSVAGWNTDYLGVLETLRTVGGLDRAALAGKRVAVLGAGGVCRAIVAAMISAGANVVIFNRTESKAQALPEEFHCAGQQWDQRSTLQADIIINGTSLGMYPHVDSSPLPASAIARGSIVFDTVYNPLETTLLRDACDRGARTIDGANMLVFQAAEQIKLFEPFRYLISSSQSLQKEEIQIPVDIMKKAVLSRLQKKQQE